MTEPAQGVSITLVDVYREVTGMRTDLAKVSTHMERVDTRNEAADLLHKDHEDRLRGLEKLDADAIKDTVHELRGKVSDLEKFRWMLMGMFVTLQILAGLVEYWLLHH